MLIADLGEFWFCPDGQTIAEALKQYHSYDVICANWLMFGSSGHVDHPASIRQSLPLRAPGHYRHTERKDLCCASVITTAQSLQVHAVVGACSLRMISDNQQFHLNHHVIQSSEYFQKVEMTRGDVSSSINANIRDTRHFTDADAPYIFEDRLLADLAQTRACTQ